MTRPKQIFRLFLGAGALWLLHVLLPLSATGGTNVRTSSLFFVATLAELAQWTAALLAGSAFLLLLLTWDRRHRESAGQAEDLGTSHYA